MKKVTSTLMSLDSWRGSSGREGRAKTQPTTTGRQYMLLAACCVLAIVYVLPSYGGTDSLGVWSQNLANAARVYAMDISATNGNLIYSAGLDSGVYKTTNAGASWVAVNNGLTYNHVQAIAISQSNNNIVYCGTDQLGGNNSGVYKTTDGGTTWTLTSITGITDSRGIQAIAIHPTNPDIVWIAVFDGSVNSTVGLYKTTDGGNNWLPSNSGIGTVKNMLSLIVNPRNPNTLYCGTSFSVVAPAMASRIYKSTDGGANWLNMSNGLPADTTIGHPIRALSMSTVDTNTILAALFLASDTLGGAYLTTNGGVTWVRRHTGLQSVNGALLRACLIKPGSSTEFFVGLDAGNTNGRGVWRTTNAGATWVDFNNGSMLNTYTIRSLVFKTQGNPTLYAGAANATVAVPGRGVYEYSWEGPTVLSANPGPANNGGSPSWAMFFDLIGLARRVTITEMTTANTGAASAAFSIEFFTRSGTSLGGPVGSGSGSSSAGWTSRGTVPVTQGSVASGVSLPFQTPSIVVSPGETVGVAMRFNTVGPRYFGTGTPPYETYADANVKLITGDARSAPFTTTGSWFASRALVGEIRYTVSSVGVEESGQGIPMAFSLLQNYPNPFNPTTTIRFSVPTSAILSLKVYNILGQEVATLAEGMHAAGTYDVKWDASKFATGVYFYRLQSNNFAETKKLLLLK